MHIIKEPKQLDDGTIELGYAIDADEMNIILYKLGISQSGKSIGQVVKAPLGYFTSIHSALQRLTALEVGNIGLGDLEALDAKLTATLEEIKDKLGKANFVRGSIS